ncbi:hypothetical protein GF351_03345 [Candidatus Woesearchaeota archaeon]|nr:hypothetical protein [Candidatus Woesearchaeota archaeon]
MKEKKTYIFKYYQKSVLLMKHTLKVTLILVLVFIIAQIIGLGIVNEYIDHQTTVETGNVTFHTGLGGQEAPDMGESPTYFVFYIAGIVLLGTIIVLLMIRFQKVNIWKLWFLTAVTICLAYAFYRFLLKLFPSVSTATWVAVGIGLFLGYFKVYRPNIYIHNATEIFVYGGLAAILVPIEVFTIWSAVGILLLISLYDMYAVWKSKHMIKMAEFQSDAKVFAGLLIPYKRPGKGKKKEAKIKTKTSPKKAVKSESIKTAVLGGGDIGFPLLFAGVVMKSLMLENSAGIGFLKTMIIPVFVTIALLVLLLRSKKNRFYPAMPFITAGCFLGYGALMLLEMLF